jgi:hypothetical protein
MMAFFDRYAPPGSRAAESVPLSDDEEVGLDLLSLTLGANIPAEVLQKLSASEPETSTAFQVATGMTDDDGG